MPRAAASVLPKGLSADGIIAPGRMTFPNGYTIDVDSIYNGQVCYRSHPPNGEARWLRTDIADFVAMVRANKALLSWR